MTFTGQELTIKRNFYTQTGAFGFGLACTVDNTTGVYRLGVTGAQGALEFRLQSGRMYYQNQFVHAYESNTEFLLEAQFTSGHTNVLKDGAALAYGDRKVTGAFDYFYFTRENAGMAAAFDLNISGATIPTYTITANGYLTATGQASVTGYFVNTSPYPIKVFDSTIQASENYTFGKLATNVGAHATGAFAYTGDWATFDLSDPILTTFNTSFSDVSVLFTILNVASYNRFVQITGPTDFTFNADDVLNRNLTYLNFSGGFATDTFNADLLFSLSYLSGSGVFQGGYVTTGYGQFALSGLVTGTANLITGNQLVSQFAWATGAATGTFSGVGTGYSTGIGYSGISSGFYTGRGTGFIYEGSGTITFGYPSIGLPVGSSASVDTNAYATGSVSMTGSGPARQILVAFDKNNTQAMTFNGVFGSGSPILFSGNNPVDIYWGSGQDILWGISGMATGARFGVTGYMSGSNLYLAYTGLGTAGNNILISKNGPLYPGAIDQYFTGGSVTNTATGYIDLSNPVYTTNRAFRILDVNRGVSVYCYYSPKHCNIQNDIYWSEGAGYYAGSYTTPASIVSGLNKFPELEFSGVLQGDKVIVMARDAGVGGNGIEIYLYSPNQGITGTNGFLQGGAPGVYATGYIQPIPFNSFIDGNMYTLGTLDIYGITGTSMTLYRHYSPNPFSQVTFFETADQCISCLSGSAVGTINTTSYITGASGTIFLTSRIIGATGNGNYASRNTVATQVNYTGGGFTAGGIPTMPIGPYTGDLTTLYITGSGLYVATINQTGLNVVKTFTGSWDFFTGTSTDSLVSMRPVSGPNGVMTGRGTFPPNSYVVFQVNHYVTGDNVDSATLLVSGADVLNPLSQIISLTND